MECTACGRNVNPAHGTICRHPCLNVLVCKVSKFPFTCTLALKSTLSGVVDCVTYYVVVVVRYGIPVMQDGILVACDIVKTLSIR